jgi:hypothetical protein
LIHMKKLFPLKIISLLILIAIFSCKIFAQQLLPTVPDSLRGTADAEREGTHDANNIRTVFYNYGMVGDYPPDPLNVDLSVFHSVEIPKGSGQNNSDGYTPYVLSKITQVNGTQAYIMETGYRERQGQSPYFNRVMRFEPRPPYNWGGKWVGYFQPDPTINAGRSPAISNDPRTWPDLWIDKLNDPDDPGWPGSWDGYFGKAPGADQESYYVYDDQYYDAWNYFPDSRDHSRKGLGLSVEQRNFQWANIQAGNVLFSHYDISNESTTDYINNIIFGLYNDTGVGGEGYAPNGIVPNDDNNAFFTKQVGLNLVYNWESHGIGMRGPTGYLGYSYLETPGNPYDGIDNDNDGITDERRDSGPGQEIIGQDNIKAYVQSHYNMTKFEAFYGKLENRPAYKEGVWWTGDEDMDWVARYCDTGADGVFGTHDTGEGDGKPTEGEPNFDKTDIDESDQIGLTGFKFNRIRAEDGISPVDNIVFYNDDHHWPQRLYALFTNADSSFDVPLIQQYNLGFLFASGPFRLPAGDKDRFSLALGWGANLQELETTTRVVAQIYKANYQFAIPPPMPTLHAFAGDHYVTLTWNNAAEQAYDPLTATDDFEGYRIYRSTDPTFLDPKVISTATGTGPIGNGKPIAQFDLKDGIYGFSNFTVEGVAYYLGDDSGLSHSFTDTTVTDGQLYYYAVCAYDKGSDSLFVYPSENAISVSQTLRGGVILPKNVVSVIPNALSLGYKPAEALQLQHTEGTGTGVIKVDVKNSTLVPDNHTFRIIFFNPADTVRAKYYAMVDETAGDTLFSLGYDLEGQGTGPIADGILPIISTQSDVTIDSVTSGFASGSKTNLRLVSRYAATLPISLRRPGYPDNIQIIFSDQPVDTSVAGIGMPSEPTKFKVIAKDPSGDIKLKFRFRDIDKSGTFSTPNDYIEILTASNEAPTKLLPTWHIDVDTGFTSASIQKPGNGDVYDLNINVPYSSNDSFTFVTAAQKVDQQTAKEQFKEPYVVPNPYIGQASFEPQRYAVSGRGERKIEFRGLPQSCVIRIYTVTGELVKTIEHDGLQGYEPWDLRTKDNLEVAPGLYIFQVDGPGVGTYIGKFAIVK